jgi:helicase
MRTTFYFHQKKIDRVLFSVIDRSLSFLDRVEMIVIQDDLLFPTEYGSLISQLYIDPLSADLIVEQLTRTDEYSDIGLLQVLCSTPDMFTLYVTNKDRYYLERFVLEHEQDLWLDLPYGDDEEFFRGLKTAMVLFDWGHELADATICDRYAIGAGDIYALVESINWLMHATSRLARMFKPRFSPTILELELCMKHGIKRELIPLIRIRNIGRVRARRLFSNGFMLPK